uniref:RING-type domain-containing protein n=1 Tax=Bubo bubo TaxID=30461 RepID=A0A8C0IHS5_BUBBB
PPIQRDGKIFGIFASCSICLELFQDPVSIHCGHRFCRACITQTWEGRTTNFTCPQCRETVSQQNLRPNWELASIAEVAKSLKLQPVKEVERGELLRGAPGSPEALLRR